MDQPEKHFLNVIWVKQIIFMIPLFFLFCQILMMIHWTIIEPTWVLTCLGEPQLQKQKINKIK